MIAFVGESHANEKQTTLEVIGPEAVRARAIELQRMDPAVFDPAIDGDIPGCTNPTTCWRKFAVRSTCWLPRQNWEERWTRRMCSASSPMRRRTPILCSKV